VNIHNIIYPFDFSDGFTKEEANKQIKSIHCPVCGSNSDIQPFSDNLRESGLCKSCGSWNRKRVMAVMVCEVIEKMTGARVCTLADSIPPIKIFNAEWQGPIYEKLKKVQGYTFSRYAGPSYQSGKIINGITHQDLLKTSFDECSFDIVLTADVLEHIPDPYFAHKEIYRILKKGGVHLFTVPSYLNFPLDTQKAAVQDGQIVSITDPEWHGEKRDDRRVYTYFGLEMIGHLHTIGFKVIVHDFSIPEMGIIGPRAICYEAIKDHKPISRPIPSGLRNTL